MKIYTHLNLIILFLKWGEFTALLTDFMYGFCYRYFYILNGLIWSMYIWWLALILSAMLYLNIHHMSNHHDRLICYLAVVISLDIFYKIWICLIKIWICILCSMLVRLLLMRDLFHCILITGHRQNISYQPFVVIYITSPAN